MFTYEQNKMSITFFITNDLCMMMALQHPQYMYKVNMCLQTVLFLKKTLSNFLVFQFQSSAFFQKCLVST